eukprot:gnl/Carplike_NY0171/2637_a3544_383.p1 GENE.gnl/Carplike_NY0171/2637_a3544_383~~gnl/Carplike_NY0171/2637_a3544_383.p1  ORF type:complete len:1624 (-),score=590.72 gnl/Carplike_NY0171/2637_a3544_383:137-4699(-)
MRDRFRNGLDKLETTAEAVAEMQAKLKKQEPVLITKSAEVETMMVDIKQRRVVANEKRVIVKKEEAEVNAKKDECQTMKSQAEADLGKALPALDEALAGMDKMRIQDLTEILGYTTPPAGAVLVMEAVCIMFGKRPKKKEDPQRKGRTIDDYWPQAQILLRDPRRLIAECKKYDKDSIPDATIKKIMKYIDNPNFKPSAVASSSSAVVDFCKWVRAMVKYHQVSKEIEPLRKKLAKATAELKVVEANLAKTKATLKEVEDTIQELETLYKTKNDEKLELQRLVEETKVKLDRANRLVGGLSGERTRWGEQVVIYSEKMKNVVGDVVLSSGSIAYLGAFTAEFRRSLWKQWVSHLDKCGIRHSKNVTFLDVLADEVEVRHWRGVGLPADNHSTENALYVKNARRWPLMIDPQSQANKWVRGMEKENGLDIIKLSDKDFLRTLENDIRFGRPVLLENVGEELDPALEPILQQQVFKQKGSGGLSIKLGDQTIPYNTNFRLYITTKLPNPVYAPELCVKVTLLNFAITQRGLEDQLLAKVVGKERIDLEEQKDQLVASNAKMKAELKSIEDEILRLLNESTDVLNDESLITTLQQSKETSKKIQQKVREAEETEKEIDVARNAYRPVALRAAVGFFAVDSLSLIDPMYQYSLQWFVNLFLQAIDTAPESDDIDERLKNLIEHLTSQLYATICAGLFEKHKLLFSFLLCLRVLGSERGELVEDEVRNLLAGSSSSTSGIGNPCKAWLTDASWHQLCALEEDIGGPFAGLSASFIAEDTRAEWKEIYDDPSPHEKAFPAAFSDSLSSFQRLLVIRCLRPDKLVNGIIMYVGDKMGEKYVDPPPFQLSKRYQDSSPTTPLLFILSTGADPRSDLDALAKDMRMSSKLRSISLGQGQGPAAKAMVEEGASRGQWVLLMNVHLATSWMVELERLVESMNENPSAVHRDFRLWLTSMPAKEFPVPVLQNSVKMTTEPPKGLRANMLRSFIGFDDEFLETACETKPKEFKKILYSLSLFHAIVQERRKYMPLGWNKFYEFTNGDLKVCIKQLQLLLSKYDEVPYLVMRYLFGEINYGGNVTDDWDRRCLMTIIQDYITDDVMKDGYRFSSESSIYVSPGVLGSQQEYLEIIRKLPLDPLPEAFGLHPNAEISCARSEAFSLLESMLIITPRGSTAAEEDEDEEGDEEQAEKAKKSSPDSRVLELAKGIIETLPPPFNMTQIKAKYPTIYEESMNTVIVQECMRYNSLTSVVRTSLDQLQKAIKGIVVMSGTLESVYNCLFNNQVPALWSAKAYPSLKPLSSWVKDLISRLRFIAGWVRDGVPHVLWISGFFFPQAFLTGTLQNYARKYHLPIDTIKFSFKVQDGGIPGENEDDSVVSTTKICDLSSPIDDAFIGRGNVIDGDDKLPRIPAGDGCYIRGLFLDGARWDYSKHILIDALPKELYSVMPRVQLIPCVKPEDDPEGESLGITQRKTDDGHHIYVCPVYKTLERAGVLTTTGHSSNFVLPIELPSDKDQSVWIKRGTALVCALDD